MEVDNQAIIHEISGNISTITLNKTATRNALDLELITGLLDILDSVDKQQKIHTVILRGNGEHFCAGANVNWLRELGSLAEGSPMAQEVQLLSRLLRRLANLSKLVLARVHGRIMGGGIGLVAGCDVVFAAPSSQFCFSEARLGLIPATIAPYVLRKMGYSASLRYIASAKLFGPEEALRYGLVHEVMSTDHLAEIDQRLLTEAKQIDQLSRSAIATSKAMLSKMLPIDDKMIGYSMQMLQQTCQSQDAKEGIAAFLAKRPPEYTK